MVISFIMYSSVGVAVGSSFGVATGDGKGIVSPRTTHLTYQKGCCCIYGGGFV